MVFSIKNRRFAHEHTPMKTRPLTVFAIFIFMTGLGQEVPQSIALKPFSELKVYDKIILTLEKSDTDALLVHGNNAYELQRTENGELLKLRMDPDQGAINSEVNATLYYSGPLRFITAHANAIIKNTGNLTGETCELQAQGGGMITLNLTMTTVRAKAMTGGGISLTGECVQQEVSAVTAGTVLNSAFLSKETVAMAMGGGLAEVNATSVIKAQTKSGGTIKVFGKPKKKVMDTTYGGELLLME